MQFYIRGKGSIDLGQNDFIDKGGEGSIYGKGSLIYKVYIDPKDMIPEGKIRELKVLECNEIIVPKDILLDKKNTIVGFTMRRVLDAMPLCKLFNSKYLKDNGINKDQIRELVEKMRDRILFIHQHKCLIVDGNEFNYLIDSKFSTPYFIDTNSWMTPNYNATAIHPAIKDYHSNKFSELTDWFSFAIVACKLFTGMHPFRGGHPNYNKDDMEKRMIDNVSIFNKKSTLPPTARDFSWIPHHYYLWFLDLFERGGRKLPPDLPGNFMVIIPSVYKSGDDVLNIKLIKEFKENILFYGIFNSIEAVKTEGGISIQGREIPTAIDEEILLTERKNVAVIMKIIDKKLVLGSTFPIRDIDVACTDKMIIGNTLYLKNGGQLIEMTFNDMGGKIIPCVQNVWSMMANSSAFYSKVIYESVLGKPYLLFPINGRLYSYQVKELEGYKIVDAKHDKSVCVLIGHKDNKYDKIILRFNGSYMKYEYDCRILDNVTDISINFVVKANGTVVLVDGNAIEVFRNDFSTRYINRLENTNLPKDANLCTDGNRIMFFKENKLYTISMR